MRTMSHAHRLRKGICIAVACCLAPIALAAHSGSPRDQWTMGGQDLDNSRNQPESGINKDNVARLKAKWIFTTGGDVSATPAVANGIVYFPDLAGNFYAVDAATGAQVWQAKVSDWTGVPGDFARNDPVIQGNLVILGDQAGSLATWDGQKINGAGAHIIAVNARTGKLVWVSQVDQFPTTQVTSSPVVHDGVLYVGVAANEFFPAIQGVPCCVSRGSVVALDMQTGRKIWQTYMVPDNNGNLGGYSGGGVWSSTPVIDLKRDAIYVGTGNNLSVPKSVEQCHQSDPNNRFCADASDHADSVVALDLTSGKIKWAMRKVNYDVWNVNCDASFAAGPVPGSGALSGVRPGPGPNCPSPPGMDFDFGGSGPNLFSVHDGHGRPRDVLGVGEKSGVYWALDPEDGSLIWHTQVGPGSTLGGIEWGTATDGQRIYVPNANRFGITYTLQPSGIQANSGSWSALDPVDGKLLWQTGTPGQCSAQTSGVVQGCMALGPTSVAGGVVFAGSMDVNPNNPTMFALDGSTGKILWSFAAGSSVIAGPAIVADSLYWGAGYGHTGPTIGTPNNKLFAFSVGHASDQ